MKKNYAFLSALLLGACTSSPPTYFPFERTPVTKVYIDPDPLCHLKYSEDTTALLERALSSDPFDLYEDKYDTPTPYRHPEEKQQEQLPVESFTSRCPRL